METTNSLFFRSGEWCVALFFHFHFFGMAAAPTTLTDRPTPLPPIEKSPSYPQATVDSVDNFCKLLILLDIFFMLTDRLQNRFYTTSIMLTLNI